MAHEPLLGEKLGPRAALVLVPEKAPKGGATPRGQPMQTQQNHHDNRAPGVRRVALDTLVEICGQEPDVPAFEGRTLNVSGRGMLVESDFVPDVKTPLVMRLEHEGREVVAEALVAWQAKGKSGGRF